jgi:Uncharacterized conserved protein
MQKLEVKAIEKIDISQSDMFIELEPECIPALQGLDGFSHLNIIWWFSNFDNEESRKVLKTPQPYKKAPEIMGIFATISPIRPNPIALTTVQVIAVDYDKGIIQIAYVDAEDGSPVLDIKQRQTHPPRL